jgi:2-iminoacetate synthase ThiH
MAEQIIKQPDGKYCGFSTVTDDAVYYDATKEEIIEDLVDKFRKTTTEQITAVIDALDRGEKPYYQFTMSYEEMFETIKEVHGEDHANRVRSYIENPIDHE